MVMITYNGVQQCTFSPPVYLGNTPIQHQTVQPHYCTFQEQRLAKLKQLAYIAMATFNTRQLNVQQLCILYNWCAAVMATRIWDVAMGTRVLCIVAMETVTVQIQYLRRCSWSHKVATPSLVNLHVHINHTPVHLHLNLKRSRITTYYTTTPNMCLLWYCGSEPGVSTQRLSLQMWNQKLAAISSQCVFLTEAQASTPSGAHSTSPT